jgi:hypothetical protein
MRECFQMKEAKRPIVYSEIKYFKTTTMEKYKNR